MTIDVVDEERGPHSIVSIFSAAIYVICLKNNISCVR